VLFNSLQFVAFFPIVVAAYFATPHRFRWLLLLAASYYFYMAWRPEYVLLIIASTLTDYFAALKMGDCETKEQRRKYLWLSLFANLGLLFTFKYANFAGQTLHDIMRITGVQYDVPVLNVLLPIGISFYTFQTLSYSIDVYRGQRKPERHLGKFAVYVTFFPQLVAGPIERAKSLLPQFDEIHHFDYERVKDGLKLMLWGFFKKLVIADQAAIYVNAVYKTPAEHSGLSLLVASYLFTFQVYCDFSGYSDIAIGSSRVLGFRLMENFNRPLLSRSIGEFWGRWHISLSLWFRDYVFMPLSLSRSMRSHVRISVSLAITWTLVGLWHGASWNFVVWGAYHALLLIVARALRPAVLATIRHARALGAPSLPSWIGNVGWTVFTFHLVVIGLVFFRAATMSDAIQILQVISAGTEFTTEALLAGVSSVAFTAMVLPIVFLMAIEIWQGEQTFSSFLRSRRIAVRFAVYLTLIFAIAVLGVFEGETFIYFQF
jgi:alginate O-acetyltransferase complex protein AlgI